MNAECYFYKFYSLEHLFWFFLFLSRVIYYQACLGKEGCSIDVSEKAFGPSRCASAQKSMLAPAQKRMKLAVEVEC